LKAFNIGKSCNIFTPYLTSSGVCHTFNAKPQQELFKPSRYFNMFHKIFNTTAPNVVFPNGFGSSAGLYLLLDNKQRFHPRTEPDDPFCPEKESPNFLVSVSNTDGAFDVLRYGFQVTPGYKTILSVILKQVISTESLHEMTPSSRNCR
jgi:hypothetical protein